MQAIWGSLLLLSQLLENCYVPLVLSCFFDFFISFLKISCTVLMFVRLRDWSLLTGFKRKNLNVQVDVRPSVWGVVAPAPGLHGGSDGVGRVQ